MAVGAVGAQLITTAVLLLGGGGAAEPRSCSGPIQPDLRYNCSDRASDTPGTSGETLAEAICCDSSFNHGYAEQSGFFAKPDVALFSRINASGTTTFYDSVCGIPLFVAPRGRTFKAWQAESLAHGWPSFRDPEVVQGNVVVTKDGEVHSKCGTHLGHNLPDAGDPRSRYCLDLVCLAGNPAGAPPSPPSPSLGCASEEQRLCGKTKGHTADCLVCVTVTHREQLQKAGCKSRSLPSYCGL